MIEDEGREIVEGFLRGSERVLKIPNLPPSQRERIHKIAENANLIHFSEGKKKNRTLVLMKELDPLDAARWDPKGGGWRNQQVEEVSHPVGQFKIVTWNVLFDLKLSKYDFVEILHTERRIPHILKILEETEADIIALQEVTPKFFDFLLKEEWKIAIGNVHLKAGPNAVYAYVRGAELQESLAAMKVMGYDDAFLVGDFNFQVTTSGEEEIHPALEEEYIDVWRELKGLDPGYTHDPATNQLAYKMAQTQREVENPSKTSPFVADRFDRIYTKTNAWKSSNIHFIATEPIGTSDDNSFLLFPSDHYGISTLLSFQLNPQDSQIINDN